MTFQARTQTIKQAEVKVCKCKQKITWLMSRENKPYPVNVRAIENEVDEDGIPQFEGWQARRNDFHNCPLRASATNPNPTIRTADPGSQIVQIQGRITVNESLITGTIRALEEHLQCDYNDENWPELELALRETENPLYVVLLALKAELRKSKGSRY